MKTVSISGFGGSYEWGCQRMLELGMAWLKKHPDFDFSAYSALKGVYGLLGSNGSEAKELDILLTHGDPMLEQHGVTGAMHHAVICHLAYIHRHGYEAWLAELSKVRSPEEFFDFDGPEESCGARNVRRGN